MAAVYICLKPFVPSLVVMGGSWYPYLVGAIFGHIGTIIGWAFSSLIEAFTKSQSPSKFGWLSSFDPFTDKGDYWSHTQTLSTTSTTSVILNRTWKWFDSESSGGPNSNGVSIELFLILALLSWGVSGVLVVILWRRQFAHLSETTPPSPTLRELAQSQLAELRLRRHGLSQSGSPIRV